MQIGVCTADCKNALSKQVIPWILYHPKTDCHLIQQTLSKD